MTLGTTNGRECGAVGARPGPQVPFNTASEAANAGLHPAQRRAAVAFSHATAISSALATSEQKLGAALRLIDHLRSQESRLKRKVSLLSETLAQVRQFAYHDELTRLPNRRLLADRFNQAIARAARQRKLVALLFLDLDRFKTINDAFGHVAGDSLLKQVAARLLACIRATDTACRFGGDEFVVLLTDLECEDGAAAVAAKIRARLAAPYLIGGTAIGLATSIGMARYPTDGNRYEDLLQRCDDAMYSDKARSFTMPSSKSQCGCEKLTLC